MKKCGDYTNVLITRSEANFDRACDEAYRYAIVYFEIDESGYSTRIRDWERCDCWIEVEFVNYVRQGTSHHYKFKAAAKKGEGDI